MEGSLRPWGQGLQSCPSGPQVARPRLRVGRAGGFPQPRSHPPRRFPAFPPARPRLRHDRRPHPAPPGQARHRPLVARHQPARLLRPTPRQRRGPVRRHGLAAAAPAAHPGQARPPPLHPGRCRAAGPEFFLLRGLGLPATATTATASGASYRSTSACCATATVAQSRSMSSKAMSATRAPCCRPCANCSGASA